MQKINPTLIEVSGAAMVYNFGKVMNKTRLCIQGRLSALTDISEATAQRQENNINSSRDEYWKQPTL